MRRQTEVNINTPAYYDEFFKERECTHDRVIRQERFVEKISTPGQIIELACGMSYFCQMAKMKSPESMVWGLDYSKTAKERMSKEESSVEFPVNYVIADALDTPFKDNFFDYVFSGELLEHLEDPQLLINEMFRICKPGGLMMLSTPHLETHDPEHLWEYDPDDVEKMFEKIGCKMSHELLQSDIFKGRYYIICHARKP